jgi:hypothetical protein
MRRWALLVATLSLVTLIGSSRGSSRITGAATTTKYNAMFGFGDSVTETGNICIRSNTTEIEAFTLTHPPYGETYFGRPSCRWSDGRIALDFIGK